MNVILTSFNVQHALKEIAISALNDSQTIREAAKKMGVSDRTIYKYIRLFKIKRVGRGRGWYIEEETRIAA